MNEAGIDLIALNGTYYLPFYFPARLCSWPLERLGAPAVARAVHKIIEVPLYMANAACEAVSELRPFHAAGWGIIALGRKRA
jgi:hypothetical protein